MSKSGNAGQAISLPKGGGALQGIGETFSPDLHTGTGNFGVPIIFDVTHSLQLPGGLGHATGGLSQYIERLARAGVACGVDGIFMEVHDAPERAPSDGPNMLPLDRMANLLESLRNIHELVRKQN